MMDEMNVLNAPKKVVDGLTEVFEGLAQMFEGVSDQLELLGADVASEDKRIFPIVDQKAPAVSEKKGAAASHPRKKPIKKTRKVEEASDKLEEPFTDSNSDATADTQPDAENSAGEAEEEENFPADDADDLPWGEDTGQVKETCRKDEPPDKTKQSDKAQPCKQETPAAVKTPSAVTITKDDITAVIVAKIKKKRDNNEKICLQRSTKHFWQMSPRFKGGHHAGSTCNPFCFQLEEVAELYAIGKAGAELSK